MLRLTAIISYFAAVALAASQSPDSVTFNKDVLPILQKNCQNCHRPGEVAPMSLVSYAEARPWAMAIKAAVLARKMPPWFADPQYGHFANDRRLSEADIHTLVAWTDNGALEGNPHDAPSPLTFTSGWNIKPDMVIEMPKDFALPATGTINYQFIRVKGNFTEDLWVTAAEMRPGNSAVVHHGKVWVVPPGSKWMANAVYGEAYENQEGGRTSEGDGNDILGKFNPGLGAQRFDVNGAAKFVPKGSDLVFELHYTAMGKATTDRSKLGLVLAKRPPATRYILLSGTPSGLNLAIPPGDSNAEVAAEATAMSDFQLTYIQPHMHLRGKDYELRLIYPTGDVEIVFKGKFDFEWQLGYDLAKPMLIPKGTRVIGVAHFDNSPNNKFNPDPTKEVHWGLQNWDEMQGVFLGLLTEMHADPHALLKPSGASLLPRGTAGPTLAAVNL